MKKILLCFVFIFFLGFTLTSCENVHKTFVVTFDSQGGTAVASQEVSENGFVLCPVAPTRDNYSLNGWYTDSKTEEDTLWHFDTDRVVKDMTLYAGWSVDVEQETTENLTYAKEENSYVVTGMTGEVTDLIIPSEYNGLPVTKIQGEYGTGAFARKTITSVTIPDSIIEIGQNSFYNCQELTRVNIATTSKLTTIGNNAFSGNYALQEFYIPTNMDNLGDSVFNNCRGLERFIVAEGNQKYEAANGHLMDKTTKTLIRGVNQTEILEGVKTIGKASFRKSMIKELTIPTSVEKIENYCIADSDIEQIIYKGSQAEWEQIAKDKLWNMGKESIEVIFEKNNEIEENITKMYITINGNKLEVALAENQAVDALIEILKKGDIKYTADDYGDFEKVGALGHTLPTSNTYISTEPGDVILYSGNQIVLFYGNNSWSYTRLGKIEGYTTAQLRDLLGAGKGQIQVTISLS